MLSAADLILANARAVGSRVRGSARLTESQALVLGAAFTAEYAVEGAALCNPSAVVHPYQDGLAPDQLRVAIALRCIGEGHISSIGFAEAVIDADDTWTFAPRAAPITGPAVSVGDWSRHHFGRSLEHEGHLNDLANAVLSDLPERFTGVELEQAILSLPDQLSTRPDSRGPTQALRDMAASAYHADFPAAVPLSARVLLPVAAEEDHGMEDARFVRFTDDDGTIGYRATYTAYDGQDIAPRLITSPDLSAFAIHRLTGTGARNKGMALFPRLVGGHHLALSRTDGENISLGALLLDLDDPSKVIARSTAPLLQPTGEMRDGYVPRIVYSCGAILHRRTLWIPVGVGDARIQVFSIPIDELIASMTRLSSN